MKHLGQLALDLRPMTLTEEDADILLSQLRQIAETMQQIEVDALKKAELESKHRGSHGR